MENDNNKFVDFLNIHRENIKLDGFNFDVNEFENLISWWTPINDIPKLLNTDTQTLNVFCMRVYKMNFYETYDRLSGIEMALTRRAISNLGKQGNSTALNILSKHFMKLEDKNEQNVNVTILNDLKDDEEA